MAKILCLETATTICSVALYDDEQLIASAEIEESFKHSEMLTVLIQSVLNDAGLQIDNLNAVAVSNGPGSYTGLRIGMSVSKGICFAKDIPMIAISTLELMAARAIVEIKADNSDLLFCPMIDARRMEVYCALYDKNLKLIKAPAAIVVEDNFFNDVKENVFYFGDGASKCREVLSDKFIYAKNIFPSAKFMGKLAFEKFSKSVFENVSLAEPVYLKDFLPGKKK